MKLFTFLDELSIPAITKTRISKLKKLGIYTLYDLLYHFPRNYDEISKYKEVSNLKEGDDVVLIGKIDNVKTIFTRTGKIMVTAIFSNESGVLQIIWFNNRFISNSLKSNPYVEIKGSVKQDGFSLKIINPTTKILKEYIPHNEKIVNTVKPIYSLTQGITNDIMHKMILNALNMYGHLIEENLNSDFIKKRKIISRRQALVYVHMPNDIRETNEAKKRFLNEEIYVLLMYILYKKYILEHTNINKYKLDEKKDLVKKYVSSLSFELTNDQKSVISGIYKKLNQGKNINILLQGDVGSGKTVVSLIVMLYLINNGYQAVLMAPTEILAQQHYQSFVEELSKIDFHEICLLTSNIKGKKREKVLSEIKTQKAKLVIGTHSLIEPNVEFNNLGIIVIDEQHKFGVEQREKLRNKGVLHNLIVMSATPIPRSLALTLYGDLDRASIKSMPKDRKETITRLILTDSDKNKMHKFIISKLKEGTQVYVVNPLIEESEKLQSNSANKTYEEYKKIYNGFNVGLIHGKISSNEKEKIMKDFEDKKIDILISTTVIEVGINVVNANIIVIRSAERFGLSSLHQLRGRVGRSDKQGYCFLETDVKNDETIKKLNVLVESNNGFYIAEKDLEIRNSGEILGQRQSGISDLVLVDIVKHIDVIEEIKEYINDYLDRTNGEIKNNILFQELNYKEKRSEYNN